MVPPLQLGTVPLPLGGPPIPLAKQSLTTANAEDPNTSAWRAAMRSKVQEEVNGGEMPLQALHEAYVLRAQVFGIDGRRVQICDIRRARYEQDPTLDDSELRGIIFFHTGTVEGLGRPGYVSDPLFYAKGVAATSALNSFEMEMSMSMPKGLTNDDIHKRVVFANVLPVAVQDTRGNYQNTLSKAEK